MAFEKLAKTKQELLSKYGNGEPIQLRIRLDNPLFDDLELEDIMRLDRLFMKNGDPIPTLQSMISEINKTNDLLKYHINPDRCISAEELIGPLSKSTIGTHRKLEREIRRLLESLIEPDLKQYRKRFEKPEKQKKENERMDMKTKKKQIEKEWNKKRFYCVCFDTDNREQLQQILDSIAGVDYSTIGIADFCSLHFDMPLFKGTGLTLLRYFGTKRTNRENLNNLLELSDIQNEKEIEHSLPPELDRKTIAQVMPQETKRDKRIGHEGPITGKPVEHCSIQKDQIGKVLNEILVSIEGPKPDYSTVTFSKFKGLRFKSRYFEGYGKSLLLNFGTKNCNTANIDLIIKSAGFERNRLDFKNREQLREVLSSADVEYSTITVEEFKKIRFKSKKFNKTGQALLDNFGIKKHNGENFRALIKFVGFERLEGIELIRSRTLKNLRRKANALGQTTTKPIEEMDINNKEHVREILLSIPEKVYSDYSTEEVSLDYSTINVTNFKRLRIVSKRFIGLGETLLVKFGDKKCTEENLDAFIQFAGFERLKLDMNNLEQMKETLESVNTDYSHITLEEFKRLKFKYKGKLEVVGQTLLKNFGNKEAIMENLNALIRSLGYTRTEFDINNAEHLKGAFKSKRINFERIKVTEFNLLRFKIGFKDCCGQTLLRNFGDKTESIANMRELFRFAGVPNEKKINTHNQTTHASSSASQLQS
jgi:muconolactone delta-isomerase